jgi:DNA repair photolyase
MKPIYAPSGRAKEYGDLAINIYTGCNHGCFYCYAPLVLKRDRVEFHAKVAPRKGIVDAVKRQLDKEHITDKLIHLCFSCDPYPAEIDTTPTREIIMAIKESGNHVQILTKGGTRAERDFDLLDDEDWFGVTITGGRREDEPNAESETGRIVALRTAYARGIKTWVSCEPIISPEDIYKLIERCDFIDHYKFGKMNYSPAPFKGLSSVGLEIERLCRVHNRDYYIKDDLRKLYSLM